MQTTIAVSPSNDETAAPAPEAWAMFRAINARRRAVRDFDGSPIADEDIRAVLAEAQLAPSSRNMQPYRFHWIRDRQLHASVAAACRNQRAAARASTLIVVTAGSALGARTAAAFGDYLEHGGELDEATRTHYRKQLKTVRRFGRIGELPLWTPLLALASWLDPALTLLPLGPARTRHWAARGSIYAAQTLLLAAAAKGLDSCPMEGFSAGKVARLLKLPRGTVVPLVVALGRRAPDARIKPRWRQSFDAAVAEH